MNEKIMSGRQLKIAVLDSYFSWWAAWNPALIEGDVPWFRRHSKTITSTM